MHHVRLLKDDAEKDKGSHQRHDEQAQELKSDVTAIRHAQTVTEDRLQKTARDILNRVTKDAMDMAVQEIQNEVTAVQQTKAAADRRCGQQHSQTEYVDFCLRVERVQTDMTDEQVKNARRWATVENRMERLENGHGMERPSLDAVSSKGQCDTHCQSLHHRLAAHNWKIESLDDNEIRRAELDRRNIKDIEELQGRVEQISRKNQRFETVMGPAIHTVRWTPMRPPTRTPWEQNMGQGRGLRPQPQQQPPSTLQLQDHGQGPFVIPRGGPQAEYTHQPYREQPPRDREATRTRRLLPQAPSWLISTPPRWSQDFSADYGEVDLRWAQIQPYCREGFFIPNLTRTSFAECKAGRRMPRVIPMGIPEGLAFKKVRPRVKPEIKGPVPHETNNTGMGGVYGSRNQLVDPTAERDPGNGGSAALGWGTIHPGRMGREI